MTKFFKFHTLTISLLLCIFLFSSTYLFRFTIDDAFISLRYARNLSQGFGLNFNTDGSQPIEGYTNFLWVIIESTFFLIFKNDNTPLLLTKISGVLFGALNIFLIYKLVFLYTTNKKTSLLASFTYSIIPNFVLWSVGGLETSLYLFLILSNLIILNLSKQNTKYYILLSFTLLLLALTRPEGLLIALIIIIPTLFPINISLLRKFKLSINLSKNLNTWQSGCLFFLLYGIYFLWRYQYSDLLLPNTFYAKETGLSTSSIINRLNELIPFFIQFLPIIIFSLIYLARNFNKMTFNNLLLLAIALITILSSLSVQTQWMPGFRYELPLIMVLIILTSLFIQTIKSHRLKIVLISIASLWLLYPHLYYYQYLNYTVRLNKTHVALGKWLRVNALPNSSFAGWDMGAIPYYSHLPKIIDYYPAALVNSDFRSHNYDINKLLKYKPDFIAVPGQTDQPLSFWTQMYELYDQPDFITNYNFLFTLYFYPNYPINLYINHQTKHKQEVVFLQP